MKLTLKKTLKATMLITTAMLGLSSTALATGGTQTSTSEEKAAFLFC